MLSRIQRLPLVHVGQSVGRLHFDYYAALDDHIRAVHANAFALEVYLATDLALDE